MHQLSKWDDNYILTNNVKNLINNLAEPILAITKVNLGTIICCIKYYYPQMQCVINKVTYLCIAVV